MSKPKNSLYLYTSPFVVDLSDSTKYDYLVDLFEENERNDERSIQDTLLKFALDEGVVKLVNGLYVLQTVENIGSWIWFLQWQNFRSCIAVDQYEKMRRVLGSNNEIWNKLIDLYTRLGVMYDHKLLNTLANRTMIAVTTIPYIQTDETIGAFDWGFVYRTTPFIWIMVYIQTLIHTSVVKTV